MNLDDLLKYLDNYVPTEDDIKNLHKRLEEAETKFEEESKRRRVTNEWLNKEYTI